MTYCSRSAAWILLLGLTGILQGSAYGASNSPPGTEAHKFHVSYGRMAVEDTQAMLHIRLFKDDLEDALRQRFAAPDFILGADPHADSLFTAYFNETFVLKQDAAQVPGRIASSGEEMMGQETMWWYIIRFDAPSALHTFSIRHVMLLDVFDDQKNIFKVKHFPSEEEQSYYYTEGAEEYTMTF